MSSNCVLESNIIDLDLEQENDLDDDEQNLEAEARQMLESWNKDTFMKEVASDKEKIKRDLENRSMQHYDGETDFDDLVLTMEPIDKMKQVFIKITEQNPAGKQIDAAKTVLMDRIGYREHDCVPFESSAYDQKAVELNLTEGPIIPGMLEGLLALREGERADILIRPGKAYGKLGSPPLIPPDATLLYHVKIYKVWNESPLNEIIYHERSEMTEFPLEEKLVFVEEHKLVANQYLIDGEYKAALVRYKAGINCLDTVSEQLLYRNERLLKLMVTLLQNATIALNKLRYHKAATRMAKRALLLDPNNVKAFYQLAKARLGLCDYSGALTWIERANKRFPNNKCFDQLRLDLDFQHRDEKKRRDEMWRMASRGIVSKSNGQV